MFDRIQNTLLKYSYETGDLITFIEKIVNGKLHFCAMIIVADTKLFAPIVKHQYPLGITDLVRAQNFPKYYQFVLSDSLKYTQIRTYT